MVAYTRPQQRKKEESERLGEREIRESLLILELNKIQGEISIFQVVEVIEISGTFRPFAMEVK